MDLPCFKPVASTVHFGTVSSKTKDLFNVGGIIIITIIVKKRKGEIIIIIMIEEKVE